MRPKVDVKCHKNSPKLCQNCSYEIKTVSNIPNKIQILEQIWHKIIKKSTELIAKL